MKTYMPEFGVLLQSRTPGPPSSGVHNPAPPPPSMTMVNLGVLAYNRGMSVWAYIHPAGFDEVCVPHFFDDAADMFKPGDMLVIRAADGTGVRVAAIDGKTVRLTHLL